METSLSNPSLQFWLARLEQAHPQTIDLGLERVARVRDAMGLYPAFPIILVGGTNGKGSTCAYLEAILRAQGYKTGLYTSPHLLRYNERVRINGVEAADEEIVSGLDAVEKARGDISLSYFEHGTLGAMWQFVQSQVEVAILEVGLGGRLDAVNIFEPAASIVTSVDLDHQAWLGDTREQIGYEKAGIYRTGKPAVCALSDPPQSLLSHACEIGARLLQSGQAYWYGEEETGWMFSMGGKRLQGLPQPALSGTHQLQNAAGALAALVILRDQLPVSENAMRWGLRNARLAGRFQRIPLSCGNGSVELVLDVAHNPESARALAGNLLTMPAKGRTLAVFGLLTDKDSAGVIAPLKMCFDHWLVAGLPGARGQSGEALAAKVREQAGAPVSHYANPIEAFDAAKRQMVDGDRIVVFGSFLTVADILQTLCLPP